MASATRSARERCTQCRPSQVDRGGFKLYKVALDELLLTGRSLGMNFDGAPTDMPCLPQHQEQTRGNYCEP